VVRLIVIIAVHGQRIKNSERDFFSRDSITSLDG